jgi:hypothetical protein
MMVRDRVMTRVALPGLPLGSRGEVRKVGTLFVTVEFEDGRHAYYRPCQLQTVVPGDSKEMGSDLYASP